LLRRSERCRAAKEQQCAEPSERMHTLPLLTGSHIEIDTENWIVGEWWAIRKFVKNLTEFRLFPYWRLLDRNQRNVGAWLGFEEDVYWR